MCLYRWDSTHDSLYLHPWHQHFELLVAQLAVVGAGEAAVGGETAVGVTVAVTTAARVAASAVRYRSKCRPW